MAELSTARPVRLTCEYRTDPLGIDCSTPRFSWMIEDRRRGAAQGAYELRVEKDGASSVGATWASGKVTSNRSIHIEYGGPPLESRTKYHWRVRVVDHAGEWSDWSEPAWFETAFLAHEEWTESTTTPGVNNQGGTSPDLMRARGKRSQSLGT